MFSLHFATGNAAFDGQEATETARILREVAKRLEGGEFEGNVADANGNSIGMFMLDGRDE